MGYIDIIFSSDTGDFFRYEKIRKSNAIVESFKSDVEVFDVNHYLFLPKQWDFFDKNTMMLIPNYKKRNRKMSLKSHDEVINWYYYICVDKHGNIPWVVKRHRYDDDSNISGMFSAKPKVRIQESKK